MNARYENALAKAVRSEARYERLIAGITNAPTQAEVDKARFWACATNYHSYRAIAALECYRMNGGFEHDTEADLAFRAARVLQIHYYPFEGMPVKEDDQK